MSLYGAFETTVVATAVLAAVAYASARWWPRPRQADAPGCNAGCGSGCGGCSQSGSSAAQAPQAATTHVVRIVRQR